MKASELCFLVAEDHDFQRRTLIGMLSRLGAKQVLDAADGRSALELFRAAEMPVDIIISDLDMPGMDGMELIRHIGETGVPVSIILSSAIEHTVLSSVQTMTRAYGIALLAAIEKPMTLQKLEAAIERYQPPPPRSDRPRAPSSPFSLDEVGRGLQNGEFEPFFQPKIDLGTGRVEGAEALARWRHPEKGVVAPYAFIGVMEDGGLIDELTWVMLQRSARQQHQWVERGMQLAISVNLSLKSLVDTEIADRITQIVRAEDVDPHAIILEVTESAAMTQVPQALENLARLRIRGFQLSIDDYGTGYSSMQQLTRVAFTELKIDQSFVMNALDEESCRVILESSIDMARKLKIKSVAEGAETRGHWDLLRQLGCDIVQGYFVARPMAAADFEAWAAQWTPPV
ncbi:MAG TPA: EAL domain-containing response regulator [Stellaceae bacterium]|nr:EAL domain-containing response regulator [Stellaceae bacterium]